MMRLSFSVRVCPGGAAGRGINAILEAAPGGLDTSEQNENNVLHMFMEAVMLKVFVEEAAALASVTLFIGMVAVWAQVIPQL